MQLHGPLAESFGNSDRSTAEAGLETSCHVSNNDNLDDQSSALFSQHPEDSAVNPLSLRNEHVNRCAVEGCKHKGSFKSTYELTRHNQTIHGGRSAKRFVCDARGCFHGRLPWSFARSDKLTSHIKATHSYSTIFNKCPATECNFGPCTLEVLGVHICRAHQNLDEGRAVLNATPCKTRKCPMWRCGKHVFADQLIVHIQTHASEDVEAAKSDLELEGILIDGTSQSGITVRVSCPVCGCISTDAIGFMRHLATEHLQLADCGGYDHFEEWKAYWHSNVPHYYAANIRSVLPWSYIHDFIPCDHKRAYQCPSCSFSVLGVGGYKTFEEAKVQREKRTLIREHHLSLLRPDDEVVAALYPHRMAILRLCPGFVTHPVFADFDQLPQQSTSIIAETQE